MYYLHIFCKRQESKMRVLASDYSGEARMHPETHINSSYSVILGAGLMVLLGKVRYGQMDLRYLGQVRQGDMERWTKVETNGP